MDGTGTVLAGHGRVETARLLGLTAVPCVRLEHMTPAQKRAYVLADNKLALNAGWDDQLLGEELAALIGVEDLGFDLSVTGFSIADPGFGQLIRSARPCRSGSGRALQRR